MTNSLAVMLTGAVRLFFRSGIHKSLILFGVMSDQSQKSRISMPKAPLSRHLGHCSENSFVHAVLPIWAATWSAIALIAATISRRCSSNNFAFTKSS